MNNDTFKTATRRIAAGTFLIAAPVLIALGTATPGQAQSSVANAGPGVSHSVEHQVFPAQNSNFPKPGTAEHHHHQWNHAK